jgi:hypothetical protein
MTSTPADTSVTQPHGSSLPEVGSAEPAGPLLVYRERRRARLEEAALWARRELWVSIARLLTAVAAITVAWLAIQSRVLPLPTVAVPIALFLGLLSVHERILRRRTRAQRGAAFYEEGLLRLEGRWAGMGSAGRRFAEQNPHHLYAGDLDLFGEGSLFELLCRARTRGGEEVLATWLLSPAVPEEVLERQGAVTELSSLIDLREQLATLGAEVRSDLDPEDLLRWSRGGALLDHHAGWRWATGLAGAANVAAALAWWPLGLGPTWLLALATLEALLFALLRSRLRQMTSGVERSARDLEKISESLDLLQQQSFTSSWLQVRQGRLRSREAPGGTTAAEAIDRLRRLVELRDSQRNPFFAPIALLLLWGSQLGLAIDGWRARHGTQIETWLEVLSEIEAIASLAAFAAENPSYCLPRFAPPQHPFVTASGLGHPLLGQGDACELNDVSLGTAPDCESQALVISGSNMSGKSTFLRACGTNVVLALAGAPVRARTMSLAPLAIGASIQVSDSLREGSSKFYAEITRLRSILDLCNEGLPVLFLLDEILHGTNSHDRRIGAEAVVRALLDRGAIGLVTTHDLALAAMATSTESATPGEPGPPRLLNKHFVDTLSGGKITFDYQLRDGVVQRSNALALMREVGLDV